MSEAARDAKTAVKIKADRHLYDYLQVRLVKTIEATHRCRMHFRRPDSPDVYEYGSSVEGAPPLFLEVVQEGYDAYTIRLKGGAPGEARRMALEALRGAILGMVDAFAIDVSRDKALAERERFAREMERIVAELVESE